MSWKRAGTVALPGGAPVPVDVDDPGTEALRDLLCGVGGVAVDDDDAGKAREALKATGAVARQPPGAIVGPCHGCELGVKSGDATVQLVPPTRCPTNRPAPRSPEGGAGFGGARPSG